MYRFVFVLLLLFAPAQNPPPQHPLVDEVSLWHNRTSFFKQPKDDAEKELFDFKKEKMRYPPRDDFRYKRIVYISSVWLEPDYADGDFSFQLFKSHRPHTGAMTEVEAFIENAEGFVKPLSTHKEYNLNDVWSIKVFWPEHQEKLRVILFVRVEVNQYSRLNLYLESDPKKYGFALEKVVTPPKPE